MTSSPRVHPHSYSVPHTPLAGSPNASPSLHPLASNMAKSPPGSGSMTPIALSSSVPKNQTRSFVRAPQVRPYQSALTARAGRPVKEVVGDTRHFADIVVGMVEQRRDAKLGKSISEGRRGRGLGLGDCAAVHWESDKAELIVDIPVWSPGSFQGMSIPRDRIETSADSFQIFQRFTLCATLPSPTRTRSYRTFSVPTPCPRPTVSSRDPPHRPLPTRPHLAAGDVSDSPRAYHPRSRPNGNTSGARVSSASHSRGSSPFRCSIWTRRSWMRTARTRRRC